LSNTKCDKSYISLSINGIRRLVGKTAFVFVSADADIPGFAPRSAPGVLDFPVGVGAIFTISNGENTVIKSSAASATEDTRFVKLEARLISFNSNRDWSDINSRAESVFSVSDIFVARELGVGRDRATGGDAFVIFGNIRIRGFSAETVGFNVFEGGVH